MQPEKPTKNHKSTFKINFCIPNLEPKTMKPWQRTYQEILLKPIFQKASFFSRHLDPSSVGYPFPSLKVRIFIKESNLSIQGEFKKSETHIAPPC